MARAKSVKSEDKQEQQATQGQEALTPTPEAEPEKPRNKGGRPRKVKPEAEAIIKETSATSEPEPPTKKEEQAEKSADAAKTKQTKPPQKEEVVKVEQEATPGGETPETLIAPKEAAAAPSPLVAATPEVAPPPMEPGEGFVPAVAVVVAEVGGVPVPSTVKATSRPADQDVPMKPNPLYIETKSKRIQITLQPSVYNGARKLAEADGLSFNEFVHRKLEEAISRKNGQ